MKLPTPDSIAQAYNAKLTDMIRHEIQLAGGFITFARFMELALYAPGLGYYSAGQHKFGKGGDFVTAPEISPLFSQCVALQCKQILDELEHGDILELGAGSGVFAKDVLLELESLNSLPEHYYILEISAELRARQKELLAHYCPHLLARISWLDALPATAIDGIIFANEVLDAMPVHCFRIDRAGIKERCVTWGHDHFTWLLTEPATPALTQHVESLIQEYDLPEGYESEINLMLPAWINSITACLDKGVILLLDYGYGRAEYYHPERSMGTLMCYYQHQRHDDPFKLVGLQDITAHVDFTTVAENACTAGCTLAGYTIQAAFLLHCDLLEIAQKKEEATSIEGINQAQAIKKLILPSEMGELIKVMALSKNYAKSLRGFPQPDRRRDL
jgi:SAM-dependent MidA family methyltransferase